MAPYLFPRKSHVLSSEIKVQCYVTYMMSNCFKNNTQLILILGLIDKAGKHLIRLFSFIHTSMPSWSILEMMLLLERGLKYTAFISIHLLHKERLLHLMSDSRQAVYFNLTSFLCHLPYSIGCPCPAPSILHVFGSTCTAQIQSNASALLFSRFLGKCEL